MTATPPKGGRPARGSRPRTVFRRLDGILLLDKPAGLSSNQALQRVRHLLRAEKGGHTGSLDPLATGLLPLCFGEATKIAGLLLGSRKAYSTVARLGLTTDTDDADGLPLLERSVPPVSVADIESALAPFVGRIRQRAPIYSALKQGGEPLYAKARRGETVDAPVREVDVKKFALVRREGDLLHLEVTCGSGTYVRSLVRDLGEALGCGAHVTSLRRLWVDPFRSPVMHTLEALEAADEATLMTLLVPVEAGLVEFPTVELQPAQSVAFLHGQQLELAAPIRGDAGVPFVVKDSNGTLLGLATHQAGRLCPQRVFNLTPLATAQRSDAF